VKKNDLKKKEDWFGQRRAFEILDFKWLDGNAVALKDPNTAVIAESVANKFFGIIKMQLENNTTLFV
jgi:hypothetical protein